MCLRIYFDKGFKLFQVLVWFLDIAPACSAKAIGIYPLILKEFLTKGVKTLPSIRDVDPSSPTLLIIIEFKQGLWNNPLK